MARRLFRRRQRKKQWDSRKWKEPYVWRLIRSAKWKSMNLRLLELPFTRGRRITSAPWDARNPSIRIPRNTWGEVSSELSGLKNWARSAPDLIDRSVDIVIRKRHVFKAAAQGVVGANGRPVDSQRRVDSRFDVLGFPIALPPPARRY